MKMSRSVRMGQESEMCSRAVYSSNWTVKAWQSRNPLTVRVEDLCQIKHAISICNEEISLIKSAIERDRIPLPKLVPIERPRFPIEAEGPFSVAAADHSRSELLKPSISAGASRSSWIYWLHKAAERRRLTALARNLTKTMPAGSILVVANRFVASAVANIVENSGRSAIVVEPSYGARSTPILPSVLQRATPKSLISWVCEDDGKIGQIDAVLFVGDGPFDRDIAVLQDARDNLPIHILEDGGPLDTASVSSGSLVSGKELPKITIVTVSFNQAAYLEQTIKSVIDQNYPNLEYIIVDGGSTDGSLQIIDRYRSHFAAVIVEPDRGQSDALNKGFRLATGDIMNWLCSDDLLEPGALHRIAKAYLEHDADIIVGGCVRIGETRDHELGRHHTALMMGDTVQLDPFDILKFMRSWQRGHYFFQPETFFTRGVWEAAGAFVKVHLFYAMDYDLWLRMALAGARIRHIPAFLACSRVHASQKTKDDQVYLHQIRHIMEEYRELFSCLVPQEPTDVRSNSDGCL